MTSKDAARDGFNMLRSIFNDEITINVRNYDITIRPGGTSRRLKEGESKTLDVDGMLVTVGKKGNK